MACRNIYVKFDDVTNAGIGYYDLADSNNFIVFKNIHTSQLEQGMTFSVDENIIEFFLTNFRLGYPDSACYVEPTTTTTSTTTTTTTEETTTTTTTSTTTTTTTEATTTTTTTTSTTTTTTTTGIVTSGLVLYWDPGNASSYPGSGTTIFDLSGNNNDGTLLNQAGVAIEYSSSNGGIFKIQQPGSSGYIYNLTLNLSASDNTIMGASRYAAASPRGRVINSHGNNWLMGHWQGQTENYYAEGTIALFNGPADENWRIYSATGNLTTDYWELKVNDVVEIGNNGGSQGPIGIDVGRAAGLGAGEDSNCEFGFLLAYNRVLTSAELTQNFNFFKARYGIS